MTGERQPLDHDKIAKALGSTYQKLDEPKADSPIPPSVGRVVLYWPSESEREHLTAIPSEPLAASIAAVHQDGTVNLTVHDAHGHTHSRTKVGLVQAGCPVPAGSYCSWMPYQIGQAAKSEGELPRLKEQVQGLQRLLYEMDLRIAQLEAKVGTDPLGDDVDQTTPGADNPGQGQAVIPGSSGTIDGPSSGGSTGGQSQEETPGVQGGSGQDCP